MADDEHPARPTVNTAGTYRSPTRAGTRRDAIRRRALRHAIRRRALRHATTIPHAVPSRTRSGDGRYGTRRPFSTPCPAMGDTARDDHPRLCARRPNHTARDDHFLPGDARWCPVMPGYVRLCPVVRRPGGLIMFSYVRLCPVMPGYARLCPVMSGYVRLCLIVPIDAWWCAISPAARTVRHGVSGCERPNGSP